MSNSSEPPRGRMPSEPERHEFINGRIADWCIYRDRREKFCGQPREAAVHAGEPSKCPHLHQSFPGTPVNTCLDCNEPLPESPRQPEPPEHNPLLPDTIWVNAEIAKKVRAVVLTASYDQTDDSDVSYTRTVLALNSGLQRAVEIVKATRDEWQKKANTAKDGAYAYAGQHLPLLRSVETCNEVLAVLEKEMKR